MIPLLSYSIYLSLSLLPSTIYRTYIFIYIYKFIYKRKCWGGQGHERAQHKATTKENDGKRAAAAAVGFFPLLYREKRGRERRKEKTMTARVFMPSGTTHGPSCETRDILFARPLFSPVGAVRRAPLTSYCFPNVILLTQ